MTLNDLSDYPCPCNLAPCSTECAEAVDACDSVFCRWLDIYRAQIALRPLRDAVLGGMTPEEAAWAFRDAAYASDYWGYTEHGAHVHALADVVEGM
jgi:hypothetical protein